MRNFWGDPAWIRLREALISDAILVRPDYTRDFLLDCDGSGEDLGAVLLQAHDEGEKVVAYASRSLLEHEKKWTMTELGGSASRLPVGVGGRRPPCSYR